MRTLIALCLCALSLNACQAGPAARTAVIPQNQPVNVQAASAPVTAQSLKLPLSPALIKELQQPDTELEPRDQNYNERLVAQLLDPLYVHAHSYYFDHLDRDGQSTVESILRHDGHTRAADLTKVWREVLSEGSVWPDRNSTTYNGRFTALEHGQVSHTKGWFMFRNASTKAHEYYQLALKAWKPGLAPDHKGQEEAWAWLGRTSHFIQDLSVPFHTMSMVRPAQLLFHHGYEISSEERFDTYLPSRNHNPEGIWAQGGPYPANGQWGIYFAPGTSADKMIFQLTDQSRPFYKLVNKPESSRNANWEKSRSILIPVGAKTTAGLVMAFLTDTGALR